ncbi:MAG: glycosyl transferase [Clostridia bacterium]|nr:glycosyl transferase [Clostridia bacterium]
MINKTIHYCWFGQNSKPKLVEKCIKSWKKYCPDYKIIEWNEVNFDIASAPLYVRQAYEAKKWAFATDYIRLWIIYNYGGIYLDTDVELIKSLDPLLHHNCFIGRQPGYLVNTGAGFGAIPHHPLIKIMLDDYNDIAFIKDNGEMDLWTCPHRNSQWLLKNGLKLEDSYQEITDAAIYPVEYFSPLDAYTRHLKITDNTYSVHHCDATWKPSETMLRKNMRHIEYLLKESRHTITHIPHRLMRRLIGDNDYETLKQKLKGTRTK